MPIAFSVFPGDFRTPGVFVEIDPSRAVQGLPGQEHRVLLIVQKLADGIAEEGQLIEVFSADDGKIQFGDGSVGHHMVQRAKAANRSNRIFAIALEDESAGVKATGKVTFTGEVTAAGTLVFYAGGRRVRVACSVGMTADDVCDAFVLAITDATSLGVVAVVDGTDPNEANLTAKHKGLIGNEIDLRFNYSEGEEFPAGLSATITAMSGGTTNPDVSIVFAAIGDAWFNEIALPYLDSDNQEIVHAELVDRWNPLRQIEGVAYCGMNASLGTLTTYGEGGQNSPFIETLGLNGSPTPGYEIGAVLASLVASEAQRDPARPLTGLKLLGVLAPAFDRQFTLTERNVLLHSAISTAVVDSGGDVVVDRLITMYRTNQAGTPDESLLDLNTVLLVARLRFTLRARIAQRFARARLASISRAPGVVTPIVARAEIVALADEWEAQGWIEDVKQFRDDLQVEINDDPVRLDVLVAPNLVNPLLQTAVLLQFIR